MKAMILAAGIGSRLDPLTRNLPKPLVPIVNKPVMAHIIELLVKYGFEDVMINVHYHADMIQDYFGDGNKWGIRIHYSVEDKLWGDAGSVKRCADFFDGTFLVMGGDDLSDIDLNRLLKQHRDKKAVCTIALSLVNEPSEYGIVLINERGRITRFLEKPKGEVIFSNMANTGVYLFEPEIFELIPRGENYGFGHNVFPQLLEQKRRFYGYLTSSYWRDVGNLKQYRETHKDALQGKVGINFPIPEVKKYVWMGENVEIHPTAEIGYPVVIGNNCRIEANARVLENTVLADNCVIEADSVVRDSIMWEGTRVMENTMLERCVVGNACHVKSNAAVFDGLIVDPIRR